MMRSLSKPDVQEERLYVLEGRSSLLMMMMEFSFGYILTSVLYVTSLVGFTVNVIILAANFMKWKSLRSLQTCDQILNCLAICRALGFLTVIFWYSIFNFFGWLLKNSIAFSAFYIQAMFMFYGCQWIATLLCVFYCVKIVTYNYKLFLFLKTRISTMVPWLIPASLLISLISSLPYGWYGYDFMLTSFEFNSTENMTECGPLYAPNFNNLSLMFALGSFPPFIIFCVAISLLIHFLLVHTRRMRSNESHLQSPNLTSHFGALKSMSFFLLLQVMFFICMCLHVSGEWFGVKFEILSSWITLYSPLLLHSLYMIYSSSEVRKMFTSMCLRLIRRP